ncbi:major facilitator superfamily-like protein [Aureococcus anophagefferens]|nr:major facilitator superfamily-like protein [Aureococcus anophagefferens]
MVEFGLAFQRSRRPEWVSFYIDYDALKRLLATAPWEFLAKLVQDIETCALHSLEEAGRIAALLRASRAEAGLEALLRLVAFVELNLVAVRKILKKHDKTFEPCTRAVARTAHMRLLESFERQWPALLRTGLVRGAPPRLAAECSRAVERCSAARAGLRVRYASLNVVDADLASSEAALGHSLGLAAENPEVFPNVQYAGVPLRGVAACEVFLGSTSAVSSLAFGWKAHDIGAFLGVVCLLTMPLSKMVEAAAATFDDREILFAATAATACGALALATATGFAYVWAAAGGALFLGASTMESALMSLIGQWAKRDAGVLVTLFGAGGRLVGDGVVFAAFAADHPGEGPARLALSLFGPLRAARATVALLRCPWQRRRNTKPVGRRTTRGGANPARTGG